jgi:hypothetical protein
MLVEKLDTAALGVMPRACVERTVRGSMCALRTAARNMVAEDMV